jgi:hypothetical protein
MIVAAILFVIHLAGVVYISVSKKFGLGMKRRVIFFYVLGVITFLGFYILSHIGFNSFVERYSIAGGIILFVSFWSTIALILKKWLVLIPLGLYISLTFMLQPMPSSIDYRNVAKELDSINNVQRYIFTSPTDMIDSQFYMVHQNVYYLGAKAMYPGWALLNDSNGVTEDSVKAGDYLVAPKYDQEKFVGLGYTIISNIGNDFVVFAK